MIQLALALLQLHSPLHAETESAVWQTAGFAHAQIDEIDLTPELPLGHAYAFEFRPTFVVYRGTGWTLDAILERAKRTTHIYAQCDVAMAHVKIVTVDAPLGQLDIGWTDGSDRRVAEATPETSHPLIYFVRYNRDGDYAFTWRKSNTAITALKNTTWMTRSLDEDLDFRNSVSPTYEVLAHELGHLLGDMGHLADGSKSLMAEDAELLSGDLSPALCERIRASDQLKPLR